MKGFYTNLGLYTEGHLVGEWIEFPIDEDELHDLRIRLHEDPLHEEFFFTDWDEIGPNIQRELGEYPDIELCNQIAELSENEQDLLDVFVEEFYNISEAIDMITDGNYIDWGCETMADVAREHIGASYSLPEEVLNHIDYDAWGHDIEITGHFLFDKKNRRYIEITC